MDFADEAGYKKYAAHPEHTGVITRLIKPLLKPGSRTAVQYSLVQTQL